MMNKTNISLFLGLAVLLVSATMFSPTKASAAVYCAGSGVGIYSNECIGDSGYGSTGYGYSNTNNTNYGTTNYYYSGYGTTGYTSGSGVSGGYYYSNGGGYGNNPQTQPVIHGAPIIVSTGHVGPTVLVSTLHNTGVVVPRTGPRVIVSSAVSSVIPTVGHTIGNGVVNLPSSAR